MISVDCLMPTIKSHAKFRPTAEQCFREQQFPADWDVQLIINEDETKSLGAKLNSMIATTSADFYVLWDDDDFHSPTRVACQVKPLMPSADVISFEVSGTSQVYYHDGKSAWLYRGNPDVWMYGLAFRRDVWEKHHFEDISIGVDTKWLKNIPVEERFDVDDPEMSIATIHSTNTCRKNPVGPQWSKADFPTLQAVMREMVCQLEQH